MDHLLDLARRRGAAVLGLGISGQSAASYLLDRGVRPLYLIEERDEEAGRELVLRGATMTSPRALPPIGLLVRSPGISDRHAAVARAREVGAVVTGEIGLWFSASRIPTIGVTGSDGKTTTVTLANAMLTAGAKRVLLGGNIGRSLLPCLGQTDAELALLELSSFQLLDAFPLDRRDGLPLRAAILNLSENHLDFHGTIDAYLAAKRNILSPSTVPILPLPLAHLANDSRETPSLFSLAEVTPPCPARLYFLREGDLLCRSERGELRRIASLDGFALSGEHNLLNLLAAVALCDRLVSDAAIASALRSVRPVSHRMTPIGRCKGALCIDSSIDSTPTRTATTLRAIKGDSIVLLLGGASKDLSLSPLTEALDRRVRAIFAFGREGRRIARAITESGRWQGELSLHSRFDEAVLAARATLNKSDLLLLSPACTSYDEFHDYTERSERFRALLKLDDDDKGNRKP